MKLGLLPNKGFQDFVDQSATLSATSVAGTPGAGVFYSTVVNRASIPTLSNDLKAQMGVERIMTQSVYQILNEFGPNGEPVWGLVNDTLNQVRAIGSGIQNQNTANGGPNFNNTLTNV